MADKQVMEAYKEQVKAEKLWDNRTFAQLMEYSAVEAAQYCVDCGIETIIHGLPAAEYVAKMKGDKKEETPTEIVEEKVEEIIETPVENKKDDGLTKEDIQELLKANNVKFHPATGIEKLVNLAKENGLL